MAEKPVRLRFTEDDLADTKVAKAASKAERAADKADKANSKLPTKRRLRQEPAAAGSKKTKLRRESTIAAKSKEKLRFGKLKIEEVEAPKPKARGKHAAAKAPLDTVSGTAHREISRYEDDNVGVQAAHQSEEAVEGAAHVTEQAVYSSKLRKYEKAEKLVRKSDNANVEALYQKYLKDNPEATTNPLSRWMQKQAIKKEYAAARAAGSAASNTSFAAKGAESAVKETGTAVQKVTSFVSGRSHALIVIGVLAVLVLIIVGMFASCSLLLESGTASMTINTYPSADENMLAAEEQYCALEQELQDYLDSYESTHEYDEYVFELDDIEHDPYVLISLITALMNGNAWTIDEVEDILQMLFDQQYILTETVTTEIRYRTETRTGTRTVTKIGIDPETGAGYEYEEEEEYEYEVELPYTYYICTVTLENFNLSHVPVYIMGEDQLSLYAMYMSTLGNRPDLFSTSEYVTLYYNTEYTVYEIPPEALTNEQFANMIAEAEKYLGYPYVWGGSSPSTSFDCSGFVSWVINNCGNGWSVGRLGANGLLNICTVVSPSEAQPGDLIFFQGTYDATGASHVGIYVGDGMMIHCGNPIQYTSINTSYWQNHFLAFGRLPGM